MKKLIFFLALITQVAFGQINTSTVKAGKYQMNIPELGVKKDSAVVWDGATKIMKFLPVSSIKGITNLDFLATPTGGTVFSSTGVDANITARTDINAGLMLPSDKAKLDGIQAGATANDTDANLKNRANHTGTQAISTVIGLQAAIDSKINISLIGANNGVAPLDAGGKVPFANLPAALMIYKGMWNPITNTPTLADGTGVAGWVYKVSVDGSANLGSGTISYLAGDFLIHNGTKWERSAGTDNVVSVNGQQGVVSLTTANIPDTTNKRYQTDSQQAYNDATSSIQTQLNGKQAAGSYESAFSKNTAFNKNFGTTAGTVAEGNDSRINNGQTAYTWGNHASKYVLNDTSPRTDPNAQLQSSSYRFDPNANNPTNHHYSISTFGNNGNVSAQLAVRLSQGDTYTRSYDASWSTWRKLLNDLNFNSYSPTLTGIGASGTWGINITGNSATASTANLWKGYSNQFGAGIRDDINPNSIIGFYSNGEAYQFSANRINSFLGINNSSTLSNSITGNAGSTTLWGGLSADFSGYTSTPYAYPVYDATVGKFRLSDASAMKPYLGLGSYASSWYMPLMDGYGGSVNDSNLNFAGKLFAASNASNAYGSFLSFGYGTYLTQFNSDPNKNGNTFIRVGGDGGGSGDWFKIWTSGNFNPANYLPLTGGTLSGTTWGATENTSFSWDLGTSRRLGFVKKAGFQPMLAYGNSDSFIISESNGANTDAGNSFTNRLVIANGGNATFSGTVTASGGFFNSDLRLKNIIKRDGDIAYFKWKDKRDLKTHIGYIAQEVKKTNPDQVQVGNDDKKTLSVNYVEILVEKIRALEKRISIQDKKIKQLQKRK